MILAGEVRRSVVGRQRSQSNHAIGHDCVAGLHECIVGGLRRGLELGPRDGKFAQRLAPVNEQARAGDRCPGDALQRQLARSGMATVQGPDPDGEHDVERRLVVLPDEVLGGYAAEAHSASDELISAARQSLSDRGRGPVDAEDVTRGEPRGDGSRCRTRPVDSPPGSLAR